MKASSLSSSFFGCELFPHSSHVVDVRLYDVICDLYRMRINAHAVQWITHTHTTSEGEYVIQKESDCTKVCIVVERKLKKLYTTNKSMRGFVCMYVCICMHICLR